MKAKFKGKLSKCRNRDKAKKMYVYGGNRTRVKTVLNGCLSAIARGKVKKSKLIASYKWSAVD